MATTTITDLIRALETTKTMVLPVDQEDASTGEIETKKIDLEQILNLFAVIGNEPPTGVAHIWTTETIPTGYLELNGQTFDVNTYPQLGLIFPSGILPDWRGRVPKHTPDGSSAGTTQEDQIKSHSHIITVNAKDLGTGYTNNDSHAHTRGSQEIWGNFNALFLNNAVGNGAFDGVNANFVQQGTGPSPGHDANYNFLASRTWSGESSYHNHQHSLILGEHDHTASCSTVGGTENTVKGVFVRYIVRAR